MIAKILTLNDSLSSLRLIIIAFKSRICFSFWISVVSSSCSSCRDSSVKSSNSFWQSTFLIDEMRSSEMLMENFFLSHLNNLLLSTKFSQLFPVMAFLFDWVKGTMLHSVIFWNDDCLTAILVSENCRRIKTFRKIIDFHLSLLFIVRSQFKQFAMTNFCRKNE